MKKLNRLIGCIAVSLMVVAFVHTTDEDSVLDESAGAITSIEKEAENILVEVETQSQVALVKTTSPENIATMISEANTETKGFDDFIRIKPNSLSDVPIPSSLSIDQNGILIIDHNVKNLFEHYLSALGEEPLENVILRIKHDLNTQFNGAALDESVELLEGYLQYRNHLGVMKNDYAQSHTGSTYELNAVKMMHQSVREARYSFFDKQAIDGLFSKEDEYDEYMVSRAEIVANSDLSPAEKTDSLSLLEASVPSWINQTTEKSERLASIRLASQSLQDSGATDSEIHKLRESAYGTEAANRLQELDQRRQQWKIKLGSYRIELNALLAGGNIAEIDQQYLNELRAEHFSDAEITRIRAIDKLELGI